MLHLLFSSCRFAFVILIFLTSITAKAQFFSSSISAATGGTGRAAVERGDAAYLNPSTLVHLRGHYFFSSIAQDEAAISLSDNSEDSVLPSALGYVQKTLKVTQGELRQQDIHLSLAEFTMDQLAFGLTGHYLSNKLAAATYNHTNVDLGLIYTPKPHIGWGLVVYNAFGEDKEIPQNFRPKLSVGGGFNYIYKTMVRLRLDATSDSIFMGGLETYINQFMISRLGYQNNARDRREIITAGLGFKGPKFGLDYAYQGNPQISADYRHSVDLAIPF